MLRQPLYLMAMRRSWLVTAVLVTASRGAWAQCPDGTPPPCGAAPVRVAVRPSNPPLDERSWIVVPFDNLARNSEVEWLRDASVNLLSLDLSRWSDIKVVDDKRVSDLVRELPRAAAAQLSLNDGLAVAKRAGAGRLVMGEVLRIGSRTTVQARVINVKDGQRLRLVREETSVQDSLMAMFGRLAEKVLDVAPPPGANVGSVGTSRSDAYQDYLAGLTALRQFNLVEARPRFESALKKDSTFALAHLGMSLLIGWDDPQSPDKLAHGLAAERFGGSLPPRERALITGMVAFYSNQYVRSCEIYQKLVQTDSTDVLALYGLGDCLYHDLTVVPLESDSTRFRFRGDWNLSFRAFQRALAVDPGFHLAFQHLLDALTTEVRNGCRAGAPPCVPFAAVVRAAGDSLLLEPLSTSSREFGRQLSVARERGVATRNLDRALEIAQAWVANAPPTGRAHAALGHIYLLQGKTELGKAELDKSGVLGGSELGKVLADRISLGMKEWDAGSARRYLDSAAKIIPAGGRVALTQYGLIFGRYAAFDSLVAAQLTRANVPPPMIAYQRQFPRILLGVYPDNMADLEAALFAAAASAPRCGAQCQAEQISATLGFGLRMPRKSWPPIDPSVTRPSIALARAVSLGDTAAVRAIIPRLDSVATANGRGTIESITAPVVAIEALLWLRDSTTAHRRVAWALDSAATTLPIQGTFLAQVVPILTRLALLRADLAAALGNRDEAKLWYGRFLAFWSSPDPEFLPLVDRVRKALSSL